MSNQNLSVPAGGNAASSFSAISAVSASTSEHDAMTSASVLPFVDTAGFRSSSTGQDDTDVTPENSDDELAQEERTILRNIKRTNRDISHLQEKVRLLELRSTIQKAWKAEKRKLAKGGSHENLGSRGNPSATTNQNYRPDLQRARSAADDSGNQRRRSIGGQNNSSNGKSPKGIDRSLSVFHRREDSTENMGLLGVMAKMGAHDSIQQRLIVAGYKKDLTEGEDFIKHGKKGSPHSRHIWCSDDFKYLHWGHGSTKRMEVSEIIRVASGWTTDVFQRVAKKAKSRAAQARQKTCFSIILPTRTLDLEATSEMKRDYWVERFEWLRQTYSKKEVGAPYNVKHMDHVNREFEWDLTDAQSSFQLHELLGRGAFGEVFRATHRGSGYELAIKLVNTLRHNRDKVEEIKREVEILKKCRNNHIVNFFGCWGPDSQGRLWILMELCSQGSLSDVLERGVDSKEEQVFLTEEQMAYVTQSALNALVYLHAKNICHRDIKSGNILFTADGHVKLTDFGISKKVEASNHKAFNLPAGSPLWMPPEIIQGGAASTRGDIWSLGILLLEMAEGFPPFYGQPAMKAMAMVARSPPPRLVDTSIWSAEFTDFVHKCLVKNPTERPDAVELLQHPWLARPLEAKVMAGALGIEEEPSVMRRLSTFGQTGPKIDPRHIESRKQIKMMRLQGSQTSTSTPKTLVASHAGKDHLTREVSTESDLPELVPAAKPASGDQKGGGGPRRVPSWGGKKGGAFAFDDTVLHMRKPSGSPVLTSVDDTTTRSRGGSNASHISSNSVVIHRDVNSRDIDAEFLKDILKEENDDDRAADYSDDEDELDMADVAGGKAPPSSSSSSDSDDRSALSSPPARLPRAVDSMVLHKPLKDPKFRQLKKKLNGANSQSVRFGSDSDSGDEQAAGARGGGGRFLSAKDSRAVIRSRLNASVSASDDDEEEERTPASSPDFDPRFDDSLPGDSMKLATTGVARKAKDSLQLKPIKHDNKFPNPKDSRAVYEQRSDRRGQRKGGSSRNREAGPGRGRRVLPPTPPDSSSDSDDDDDDNKQQRRGSRRMGRRDPLYGRGRAANATLDDLTITQSARSLAKADRKKKKFRRSSSSSSSSSDSSDSDSSDSGSSSSSTSTATTTSSTATGSTSASNSTRSSVSGRLSVEVTPIRGPVAHRGVSPLELGQTRLRGASAASAGSASSGGVLDLVVGVGHDGFDLKKWVLTTGLSSNDRGALLRGLAGDSPSKEDLGLLNMDTLRLMGIPPLQANRIIFAINKTLATEKKRKSMQYADQRRPRQIARAQSSIHNPPSGNRADAAERARLAREAYRQRAQSDRTNNNAAEADCIIS